MKVLHSPQIRTVKSNEGRVKKVCIKQSYLRPQGIPLLCENTGILVIIKTAHNGRDHRDKNAGKENNGMS